MTYAIHVEIFSKVGDRFHLVDRKISTKVVAESTGEANHIRNRKAFFGDAVFDANEDFLLGSATRKITTSSTMTSASEAEGLFAVDSIRFASFENGASEIIIRNVFVEGDGDAA